MFICVFKKLLALCNEKKLMKCLKVMPGIVKIKQATKCLWWWLDLENSYLRIQHVSLSVLRWLIFVQQIIKDYWVWNEETDLNNF